MVKVTWKKGVPKPVRETVAPILRDFRCIVPDWCRSLAVDYKHDMGRDAPVSGAIASMEADPEYRQAKLEIYSAWHTATDEFRELTIIHELTHIALQPMVAFTDKMIEGAADTVYQDVLVDQWRRTFEGAVEDISRAIQRARGGP
jgi:hypothetical protein